MIEHSTTDLARAAIWQTGTAVIQAVCSVTLLGWYVLAAHLERVRTRRERTDDFNSLVCLCRDLGKEAQDKTAAHHLAAVDAFAVAPAVDQGERLAQWRSEMTVIYVCLNEAPHYEVRNPAFSMALTRLWMEVDVRSVDVSTIDTAEKLIRVFEAKLDCIRREVAAMERLFDLSGDHGGRVRETLSRHSGRRGIAYAPGV